MTEQAIIPASRALLDRNKLMEEWPWLGSMKKGPYSILDTLTLYHRLLNNRLIILHTDIVPEISSLPAIAN